jgi:hypothetical protein
VSLTFIRPGNPTDNDLCESFNVRLRDECLNLRELKSIEEAKRIIEAWRCEYNEKAHGSLGNLTHSEFLKYGQRKSLKWLSSNLKPSTFFRGRSNNRKFHFQNVYLCGGITAIYP